MRTAVAVIMIAILIVSAGAIYWLDSKPSVSPIGRSSVVDGLQLVVSINRTTIIQGQSLGINVSLLNTMPAENRVSAPRCVFSPNSPPDCSQFPWLVQGFPISMWSECLTPEPVDFMIVKGVYSLGQLQKDSSNSSFAFPLGCHSGGGFVQGLLFQPFSSKVNLTGWFCVGGCATIRHDLGQVSLDSNFSVNGYWAYPINETEANDVLTPANPPCTICHGSQCYPDCSSYKYPEAGPVAQSHFVFGSYTLVVSDEWGQVVILNFSVV